MGHPLADVADPAAVDDPALLAQFARP
jgi:hypothetical protein